MRHALRVVPIHSTDDPRMCPKKRNPVFNSDMNTNVYGSRGTTHAAFGTDFERPRTAPFFVPFSPSEASPRRGICGSWREAFIHFAPDDQTWFPCSCDPSRPVGGCSLCTPSGSFPWTSTALGISASAGSAVVRVGNVPRRGYLKFGGFPGLRPSVRAEITWMGYGFRALTYTRLTARRVWCLQSAPYPNGQVSARDEAP